MQPDTSRNDELARSIIDHQTYLMSPEALDDAWDEARDQMPDHLTNAILAWFQGTYRYDSCFDDWMEQRDE